jgi:hypothetical protein
MSADFVPTLKEIEDAMLVLDKAVCAAEDGNLHFGTTSDASRFTTKVAGAYTTDTTIETISVELPNSTRVEVTLERDGVNPEASVSCIYEDFLGATPVSDFSYSRSVIIDGIYEEPRNWIATYEIRTSVPEADPRLDPNVQIVQIEEEDT